MARRRARGSNAGMALEFEQAYGFPQPSGYRRMSFVSAALGEEQPLISGDLRGQGREPDEPDRDAADNQGDVVVPMCARQFGLWLKMGFGAPTTSAGKPARGSIIFSSQPANNATISVGGQTFTFVTGTPTANQIKIGTTVAYTVANAVRVLNSSTVPGVAAASYRQNDRGNGILIQHDALGVAGNAFAIEAGATPASNAVASGATLTGGAASGGYRHIFTSGAVELPSAAIEIQHPEVPSYHMNFGVKLGVIAIQMQRGGNLTATLSLVAQGEEAATEASAAGTLDEGLEVARFSQFAGTVLRHGSPIADLVSGQLNLSNGLDPVPGIRGDGRITGLDEGDPAYTGQLGVRYSGPELQQQAENGEPCDLEYTWTRPGSDFSLRIILHRVFLPKAKKPVTGGGAVQATYAFQAALDRAAGHSVTIILDNDVAGSAYGGA